jgi:DedD protein
LMDDGLKQRIIGAVVLIVAAVVFLPMLLTGQDETTRVEVEVPEPPTMDDREIALSGPVELPEPEPVPNIPQSYPSDPLAPAPSPVVGAPPQVPGPAADVPPMVTAPSAPPPPPPAAAAPPAPAPAPAPAAAPTATAGNWVVQLGSFSSAENAEGLRQTLRTQGYNAYTLSIQVDGKPITRVYVGPVVEREEANRLRDELARRQGNRGLVVAYDSNTRPR